LPVVVTGAGGGIGRVLVPLLAERGEVRAVLRRSERAEELRAAGAKVAVCHLEDTATLVAVLDGAHTVVHLAGGMDQPTDEAYEAANAGTVRDTLEAAAEAELVRFILLSYPGASADASNVYLRTKGLAEKAVRESGMEHVILRSTHVYGPGQWWLEQMRAAATRPVAAVVVGPGSQRLALTFVTDLARAIIAADHRASGVAGTFGLQGPDQVTADELTDLLAGRHRRKIHVGPVAAGRAARLQGRRLPRAMLEVLAGDSLADAPSATEEFGISLTPLVEGLAAAV
jgi:nucleoside-diphosphate-sugar epimerase